MGCSKNSCFKTVGKPSTDSLSKAFSFAQKQSSPSYLRKLLLLACDCICQYLLASKFRRNKLHGAALCLITRPRTKVLKSDLGISGLVNLSELVLSHLHELSLILDLSLGQLECFICD